jgi:hypothetical protein
MGWASGSRLMNELISAFDLTIGQNEIPEDSVLAYWNAVISAFEDEDWDTQGESIGLSKLWDRAYFAEHPYDNGYFQAPGAVNPYQDGSKFAEKWQEGYNDMLREQED